MRLVLHGAAFLSEAIHLMVEIAYAITQVATRWRNGMNDALPISHWITWYPRVVPPSGGFSGFGGGGGLRADEMFD